MASYLKRICKHVFLLLLLTGCSQNGDLITNAAITTNTYSELEESIEATSDVTNNLNDFIPLSHEKLSEQDWVKVNWDNSELTTLFNEAAFLYSNYFESFYPRNFDQLEVTTDVENNVYNRSGILYESFIAYLHEYFTEPYTEVLLSNCSTIYTDINDELCYRTINGSSSNPSLDTIELDIGNETDSEITIICTVRYCHPDTPENVTYQKSYSKLVKSENGWRFDSLELWD